MIEPSERREQMLARYSLAFILTAAAVAPSSAQSVISAHSGVIQYVEGDVSLDGAPVVMKYTEFPDVKNGQTLSTESGRAEVLLTPGVFLRLAEDSSFKMVSNRLSDTRVEILTGSAMIEIGELLKDNAITVLQAGAEIELPKKGLYRADADRGSLRVYEGEAQIHSGGQNLTAKKGREVSLDTVVARNFDTKDTDSFYRWSARRDAYVSQANNAASNSYLGGYGSGLGTYGFTTRGWAWNPYFGMFTFFPMGAQYMSPFGYAFYNPVIIVRNYGPIQSVGGFGGQVNSGFSQNTRAMGRQDASAPSQPIGHSNPGASSGGGFSGGRGLGGGGGAPPAVAPSRPAGGNHR
jgi:hypothetical protein